MYGMPQWNTLVTLVIQAASSRLHKVSMLWLGSSAIASKQVTTSDHYVLILYPILVKLTYVS